MPPIPGVKSNVNMEAQPPSVIMIGRLQSLPRFALAFRLRLCAILSSRFCRSTKAGSSPRYPRKYELLDPLHLAYFWFTDVGFNYIISISDYHLEAVPAIRTFDWETMETWKGNEYDWTPESADLVGVGDSLELGEPDLVDKFQSLNLPGTSTHLSANTQPCEANLLAQCYNHEIPNIIETSDRLLNSEIQPGELNQLNGVKASIHPATQGYFLQDFAGSSSSTIWGEPSYTTPQSTYNNLSQQNSTFQTMSTSTFLSPSTPFPNPPSLEFSSSASSSSYSDVYAPTQAVCALSPNLRRGKMPQSFRESPTRAHRIDQKTSHHGKKAAMKMMVAELRNYVMSDPSSSESFRQGFNSVSDQMGILIDNEIEEGNLDPKLNNPSTATVGIEASVFNSGHMCQGQLNHAIYPLSHQIPQANIQPNAPEMGLFAPNIRRFYCTFPECRDRNRGERYMTGTELDWKRHEKTTHWPQERFICVLCMGLKMDPEGNQTCQICFRTIHSFDDIRAHYLQCFQPKRKGKSYARKDHLCAHLTNRHGKPNMSKHVDSWCYPIDSGWPRECGFCNGTFETWEQRMKHIGEHYKNGYSIQHWKPPFPELGDRKPQNYFSNTRKDDDDDDDDDDFNSTRGSTKHVSFGHGTAAAASSQAQYGQSSSSQQSDSYFQQGSYQQGYKASTHDTAYNDLHIHRDDNSTMPTPSELSLSLKMYLNDAGDRVSRLAIGLPGEPHPTGSQSSNYHVNTVKSSAAMSLPWPRTHLGRAVVHVYGPSKPSLARHYVISHWDKLDDGIFWINSKIDSEIRNSFWAITVYVMLNDLQACFPKAVLFSKLMQNMTPNLGLSFLLSCSAGLRNSTAKRYQEDNGGERLSKRRKVETKNTLPANSQLKITALEQTVNRAARDAQRGSILKECCTSVVVGSHPYHALSFCSLCRAMYVTGRRQTETLLESNRSGLLLGGVRAAEVSQHNGMHPKDFTGIITTDVTGGKHRSDGTPNLGHYRGAGKFNKPSNVVLREALGFHPNGHHINSHSEGRISASSFHNLSKYMTAQSRRVSRTVTSTHPGCRRSRSGKEKR